MNKININDCFFRTIQYLLIGFITLILNSNYDSFANNERIIVATNTIIADWIKELVGDQWLIYTLIKANQDSHTFEINPKEVSQLKKAKVIFENGLSQSNRILPSKKGRVSL